MSSPHDISREMQVYRPVVFNFHYIPTSVQWASALYLSLPLEKSGVAASSLALLKVSRSSGHDKRKKKKSSLNKVFK